MGQKFVNLTCEDVRLTFMRMVRNDMFQTTGEWEEHSMVIEPSGEVASLECVRESMDNIDGVPLFEMRVKGLPEEEKFVTYIVYPQVLAACVGRYDVCSVVQGNSGLMSRSLVAIRAERKAM